MQQTSREQLAFKQLRLQAQRDEEDAFRRTMLDKMAEDDRLEQMNAHKRRMKQQEHKRSVEKLLEERRQRRLADQVRALQRTITPKEEEFTKPQMFLQLVKTVYIYTLFICYHFPPAVLTGFSLIKLLFFCQSNK